MINTSNFTVILFIAPVHSSHRIQYFCHTSFVLNDLLLRSITQRQASLAPQRLPSMVPPGAVSHGGTSGRSGFKGFRELKAQTQSVNGQTWRKLRVALGRLTCAAGARLAARLRNFAEGVSRTKQGRNPRLLYPYHRSIKWDCTKIRSWPTVTIRSRSAFGARPPRWGRQHLQTPP